MPFANSRQAAGPSPVARRRRCPLNVPAMTLIRQTLERLVAEGLIRRETPCETLSSLLWGSFLEAGITIALSNDVAKTQREMARGLEHLFESLRVKPVV